MSDQGARPDGRPGEPAPSIGGFDWLLEPPSQPLASALPQASFPALGAARLEFATPTLPADPVIDTPLVTPALSAPEASLPSVFSPEGSGASHRLQLERRNTARRRSTGPLDWTSFAFAFLAPPIGLIGGIVSLVLSAVRGGYTSSIAKVAVSIGAALSLVLVVGLVVELHIQSQQAAHDAIVASSVAYCADFDRSPSILHSSTFGWPAPADTIPDSITAMKSYESRWAGMVKIAPRGIRSGTRLVASAALSIIKSVETTQVLDDADNVTQMQQAVSGSDITAWVSEYCK